MPYTVQIQTNHLVILSHFQILFININQLCTALKLMIHDMGPLFDIFKWVSTPTSPRTLTLEAKVALDKINLILSNAQLSIVDLVL